MSNNKINILMITGVYLPEINGAVRQCSQLMSGLRELVNYSVLTGTNDESLGGQIYIDGISVTKVFMPKRRNFKYIMGAARFFISLVTILQKIDLVHIHGFSNRNAIAILISLILKKRVIIKMTSFGQDDPMSIKERSFFLWKIFDCCNAYIGISPAFTRSYKKAKQLEYKYNFIPNGVDLDRYCPIMPHERNSLRLKYGFSELDKIIIFVGHFSHDKQPMFLYRAWTKLCEQNILAKIIFIGHTGRHFEVDERIVELIKLDALKRGILPLMHFVEETLHIDEYMKIADVLVLTSIREGLPNILLEAMACSLPCIVRDLPGVTDWLIADGESGELFQSNDPIELSKKIVPYVTTCTKSREIGRAARIYVERNFSSNFTSLKILDLYRKTLQ
jgi:glycosyltransferase involved in cell wall biosynthesis